MTYKRSFKISKIFMQCLKKIVLFLVNAAYHIVSKLAGTVIKLLDGILVNNRMLLVMLMRQT